MLVPRVYGLGDLSQILDERAYIQARAILDSLREDLSKVVVAEAYRKAARAIDKHGFVLLVGEPAAGKTTIASMLAMAAVDQWNASMLKLEDPSTLVERWNPEEPSQFFWLDDAFGVAQYEGFLVHGWNHILPQVKTMLRKGAKIVMTSRDYIYNRARRELKEGAFPLFKEAKSLSTFTTSRPTKDDRFSTTILSSAHSLAPFVSESSRTWNPWPFTSASFPRRREDSPIRSLPRACPWTCIT